MRINDWSSDVCSSDLWPFDFAPTYEGITAGFMQIARIGIMLAGVALLLTTTTRDNLMAGFFLVLYPLKWTGLNPERLAVRLWLTLHYRSEEHTSELQSLMRISYAVFCLKQKITTIKHHNRDITYTVI